MGAQAPEPSGAFPFNQILSEDENEDRSSSPLGDAISVGAQAQKDRFTDDVERFLSSIRFEHCEKMEDLGLDM
ncbi:MAG: hypothetical protein JSV69_12845 [Chloroflexota bacterium]|nr:MAG: hypothetical protein JSV69_12845 [Chloroflexota bacterium]